MASVTRDPVKGHHCPVTSTKLQCLVTETHVCEQLAQGRYMTTKLARVELVTSWPLHHQAT